MSAARALSSSALGLLVVTVHAKATGADPALAWTRDALARSLLWGVGLIVILGLLAIASRTDRAMTWRTNELYELAGGTLLAAALVAAIAALRALDHRPRPGL